MRYRGYLIHFIACSDDYLNNDYAILYRGDVIDNVTGTLRDAYNVIDEYLDGGN